MKAFVYQNRLALDYLLAEEEGVCGRFNKSECCIEIDDYGETIKGLAQEIKRWPMCRSRNGIQSSKLHGIIFLPCLIPCFIRLIHSVVQGMQIATLPMDPEAAKGGTVSKIMKLEEEKANSENGEDNQEVLHIHGLYCLDEDDGHQSPREGIY
ncbi:hypothetical protein HGM15179_019507 [Zosterops borbonicus]|uniref:Uncharacterized protein n=1 Tax=Zosterops borbonicus TaxID=364589 RepID=A0A8K1FV24_9PASS|nr:hypothetical protein HGM15179_019507 [Zosterops borbonicus]